MRGGLPSEPCRLGRGEPVADEAACHVHRNQYSTA